MNPRGSRRALDLALLASGVVLFLLAALFWTRFLPVNEENRAIVAGAVFVAALADLVIGIRFLGSADL